MSDSSADITHAALDWDADGQPLSRAFGDVYFSRANGLEETRHVFLHHNQLSERFSALKNENSDSHCSAFTIGETGFGSGLNFLAAWQLWSEQAPKNARLHFISTEKFPLTKIDLTRALALWPELSDFSQQLIDQYPVFTRSEFHRLMFADGQVTLTLIIDDAATGFTQLLGSSHPHFAHYGAKVDAWFLDGFAPAKNPQMWRAELFQVIGQLSRSETTAATFSAAGIVKLGLQSAGFAVKKVPGFGRKREMVSAIFSHTAEAAPLPQTRHAFSTPWMLIRHPQHYESRTAVIIGGGLAGCHSARALAVRGWKVTLVERQSELAQAASGNPQGVLYAKISYKQEALSAFNLASLQFALRHYRAFWSAENFCGSACGVLQLAHTEAEQKLQEKLQEKLREKFAGVQELMRFVDAAEASELAGIAVAHSAIYFPTAGWLDPRAVCKALVTHPNIRVRCNTEALSLMRSEETWHVSAQQQLVAQASVVVIANATDALQFAQTSHLPLKAIRGQVSYLPATTMSKHLKTVLCGEGYIAPAIQSAEGDLIHCAGATFNSKDADTALRASDHQTNLNNIRLNSSGLCAEWRATDAATLEGRVAFRCASPDYLPIVGPVPDAAAFQNDYALLRKDARASIALVGQYWPGLHCNLGHGSRGLAYTPLSAELLAAHIAQEPLPLNRNLVQALHPARFIIRNLQRNKF